MNIKPSGKQYEIIDLPMEGHNVVLGSAGSGKSVCALLRALSLSQVKNEKVLILTYNNSLVNYLKNIEEEQNNIFIMTYHKFVVNYLKECGVLGTNSIVKNEYLKSKFIREAIKKISNKFSDMAIFKREKFIIEEISWMQKVGCLSLEEYESITRYGRGKARIDRVNRKYIFYIYKAYLEIREANGFQYDWDDIAYYANKYVNNFRNKNYKHIIMDEGQDFSPSMIRFVVNYIGDEGSVMYLGDAAQQIFGSNGTWISSGLAIRKAYKLEQNYRNTKEIEALGNEIRKNIPLQEQEVELSQNSKTSGELPILIKFTDFLHQLNYIKDTAMELKQKGSVAVICSTRISCEKVEDFFNISNVDYLSIDRNQKKFNGQHTICIGTYHSLKGLEFDNVILYNCTDNEFIKENLDVLDAEEKEEKFERILKLLYVGVTRARKKLIVTYMNNIVSVFPTNKELFKFMYI